MEIYANFYLVVYAAACMSKICVLSGVCLMEIMCWRRMIAIFDEFCLRIFRFCFACIDNWATITNLCPLCKNEFQLITCIPVSDVLLPMLVVEKF